MIACRLIFFLSFGMCLLLGGCSEESSPPSSSPPSDATPTVVGLTGDAAFPQTSDALNERLFPLVKYENGTFQDLSLQRDTTRQGGTTHVTWRDSTLAQRTRYFIDAPPRLLTAQTIGLRTSPVHTAPFINGRVTDSLSPPPAHSRLDVGSHGGIAISLPPDSIVAPSTWIPKADTILTDAERTAIATYVGRQLLSPITDAKKTGHPIPSRRRSVLTRHIQSGLSPAASPPNTPSSHPRPISNLSIDVASGQFDTDDATDYLVVVNHEYNAVWHVNRRGQADSIHTAKRTSPCPCDRPFHEEDDVFSTRSDSTLTNFGLDPDTTERACLHGGTQAAAFFGDISGTQWRPHDATITTTEWHTSLSHVLRLDGSFVLLFHGRGYEGRWWKLFRHDDKAFTPVTTVSLGT
ncbi:hypothetical protein BSZ35_09500 [Salinibacter sp. 10B]|uniref:hypothetical protein n=1 Tax=Salinibacter sp. 10B TaxID=1923971 RepID=UPI000CF4A871|nr:hypothetical protein [Salinibacter sp. 10B]PQJ34804.1 hypothetical protein BSZ35_09500 [Salinibacter sp. 10B]